MRDESTSWVYLPRQENALPSAVQGFKGDHMPSGSQIPSILAYGFIGIGLLLAFLVWRLISQMIAKNARGNHRLIYVFVGFLIAVLVGAFFLQHWQASANSALATCMRSSLVAFERGLGKINTGLTTLRDTPAATESLNAQFGGGRADVVAGIGALNGCLQ